jgi:DNA-binding CsgD family transcriptional regulator
MAEEILLCGECKKWNVWDCPRIDTHRYGTCMVTGKVKRRINICRVKDRPPVAELRSCRVNSLSPRQAQALKLFNEGKTTTDIAIAMGVGNEMARRFIRQALEKISKGAGAVKEDDQ